MRCTGIESNILDCPSGYSYSSRVCNHFADAGVRCHACKLKTWLPCDFIDPVKTLCLYLTSQFEAINAKVAVSVSATAD